MTGSKLFAKAASAVSSAAGRPLTFLTCVGLVVLWAATGPLFHFSDTWQLVINTSTTIVTFLMVFLIQNTQNRDNAALQTKLDEVIRSGTGENAFVGIEHLSDEELEALRLKCERQARAVGEAVEARKTAGKGKRRLPRHKRGTPAHKAA